MLNDQRTKLLIAEGNTRRFQLLMEVTSDELLQYALSFVRHQEIAEELVSDVYVKIWHKRSELPNIQNIRSYLFIAVKNNCLSHLRKMKNEKIVFIDEYNDFLFPMLESKDDETIEKELLNKIYKAMGELPPKCREAFSLAKINGFKHREIAAIMSISEKTVNNHLVTALKKITDALGIEKKKKPSRLKQASLFSFAW
ncbi:RNA polymerase sigma-70 factor [Draconibacterium sp. IB214405]|uniref:RNA polymerase sigma factor n=1 Tax=Draconibacterium sp. IB214405 TaxID=3097352 RepID=UPI002A10CB92|nr:RNA polymerase sigma-70 factor [Draconibacterium sp. IB214405]MDX8340134.1 RNA polymerase sigma-70 factor [Draconibacterium sp. IB214405]